MSKEFILLLKNLKKRRILKKVLTYMLIQSIFFSVGDFLNLCKEYLGLGVLFLSSAFRFSPLTFLHPIFSGFCDRGNLSRSLLRA
jgi:hypothetical protein